MDQAPRTAAIPAALMPDECSLAVYRITERPVTRGFYAGTPAVVIRLQGCPVGCSWCNSPAGIPEPTICKVEEQATEEQLEAGGSGWRSVGLTRLLALIGSYSSRHVLITGGEPALYDLAVLTEALIERHYTVQVETSGVLPLSVHRDAWVTLSPAHGVNPELLVWDWLYKRADEVIQLIKGPEDRRWIDRGLKAKKLGSVYWIEPIGNDAALQQLCWDLARDYSVRLAARGQAPWL
jgi:7-carboxy-7-deazaguanine synthase